MTTKWLGPDVVKTEEMSPIEFRIKHNLCQSLLIEVFPQLRHSGYQAPIVRRDYGGPQK